MKFATIKIAIDIPGLDVDSEYQMERADEQYLSFVSRIETACESFKLPHWKVEVEK